MHCTTNRFVRLAIAGVLLASVAVSAAAPASAATESATFEYTGGTQDFVVPDGVTELTVDAYGAAGGTPAFFASVGPPDETEPGLGGRTTTTIDVTPGETLTVVVGGRGGDGEVRVFDPPVTAQVSGGAGGFNGGGCGGASLVAARVGGVATDATCGGQGSTDLTDPTFVLETAAGGGGGASDVRRGDALDDRLVVAGGGGGGGGRSGNRTVALALNNGGDGGGGGGVTGDNGANGTGAIDGQGGEGGTQAAVPLGDCDNPADFGIGGDAGAFATGSTPDRGRVAAGGGGGGGWIGGSCGELGGFTDQPTATGSGGGGGGSGFPADATFENGVNDGDGLVVLSWEPAEPVEPVPPVDPNGGSGAVPATPISAATPGAARAVAADPRFVG